MSEMRLNPQELYEYYVRDLRLPRFKTIEEGQGHLAEDQEEFFFVVPQALAVYAVMRAYWFFNRETQQKERNTSEQYRFALHQVERAKMSAATAIGLELLEDYQV